MEEKKAIALSYSYGNDNAPVILAKGKGKIAKYILEKAIEHDICVMEDKELSEVLYALPEGMEIPEELYKAVAQVYVFLYKTHNKFRKKVNDVNE